MPLYTALEQALGDPSIALVTGEAGSLNELNRAYVRYKVLPKRQKRLSDYYSCEFLGRSVPEMYALRKEELLAGYRGLLLGDLELPNEKYVVSEPDLYYREESFNSGDTNVCFLLGHSGSGKSVMARTLEGDDIDHIELDDLLLTKDHFTLDELKDYSGMMYAFFTGEGAKYYIGLAERDALSKEEYEDRVFTDFVRFAMDYAARHPEKKFIIDGIWLYLYFDDPSVFEDYTVFIKGTSFLKSKIRAIRREMQRDREVLQDRKEMFGRSARNYLLDEDKIDRYRSFYGSRPETVYREETSEAEKQNRAVLDELAAVDRCFVHGDADGIAAILQRAEADAALSDWNRLRILAECRSALFELKLP